MMKYAMKLAAFCLLAIAGNAQAKQDDILGKWMSNEKNLVVEVYKQSDDFKAKIVWFHNPKDTLQPIDQWLDIKNPDESLRNRKILGMDILSGLAYDEDEMKWTDGKIYDATSGKTWDAEVKLHDPKILEVRGYYIFRFLGKTMRFTRM